MRILVFILFLLQAAVVGAASSDDPLDFDDFPLEEPFHHPAWFKRSFLDLHQDLDEALAAGKQGIIVYFGQLRCAYCRQLMRVNFGMEDIVDYTRKHFDIIPVDIHGIQSLTDMEGKVLDERAFAQREQTNFTPSLIFYNADGKEALRLRGYYPPYQFRAALEFVADGHYRNESFSEYLARGENVAKFEKYELSEEQFFSTPPYILDRSRMPGERPLAVFFEQGDCHACDVLHGEVLKQPAVANAFRELDVVQLDMHADTPVLTPDGRRLTASGWAAELDLFYTPSLLFFDERGRELLRVDSVVRFYRLRNVLTYITSRAYLTEPLYSRWREQNRF